jgi:hypothetical protein
VSGNPLDEESYFKGTADNWRNLADAAYIPVEVKSGSKTYNIYPLLGTDAVHGN